MTAPIVRPKYIEGQVLAAADLEAQTTYARTDSAIHERTEHIWGIASGLALTFEDPKPGANNLMVGNPTIAPGVAVDASGRRIVVSDPYRITEREFVNAGVWSRGDQPDTKYPVFLVAIDEPLAGRASSGRCGVDAPTRTAEGYQVEIGRPGSERNVNQPTVEPATASGPGTGGKVIVGYVTWGDKAKTDGSSGFTGAGVDANVRYVGVRASSVVPHAGVLSLLTREADPRFVLQLMQDPQGKAELRFGRQTGTAPVSGLFVVDDKGDVTIAGKITSAIPSVPIAISGSVSHGMKLPLPQNVTEDMVTDGRVTLQYLVTFRRAPAKKMFPSGLHDAFPFPFECWVDPDPENRTVRSRAIWFSPSTIEARVDSAIADYMLVATPKGTP